MTRSSEAEQFRDAIETIETRIAMQSGDTIFFDSDKFKSAYIKSDTMMSIRQ